MRLLFFSLSLTFLVFCKLLIQVREEKKTKMLSGLKSYLFGANDVSVIQSAAAAATVTATAVTEVEGMRPIGEEEDKEDWVLVDTHGKLQQGQFLIIHQST